MLFFKQDASISPYSRKIIETSKRQTVDTILTKGQSKSILINDCPFCENYITCAGMVKDYLKQGQIRMPCLIRSTDTDMVWLSVREDDRKSVKVGDRYGKLIVVIPQRPDDHGNRRWLCKCDCGKGKIVRGDNLLTGKTSSCGCELGGDRKSEDFIKNQGSGAHSYISEEEKNKPVPVESKVNSRLVVGALPHRPITGNESKTGKSVDVTLLLDQDGESSPFEVAGLCGDCGGKVRFDDHGYKICELCGIESSITPDVPDGLKIVDVNDQYSRLVPQESFGQSPDAALQKLMLLDEIAMSDHIDNIQWEYYSVPFRPAEDWDFIREHGFEPGAYVEMFPPNINKANWWDRRSLPATEVLTSDFAGEEYTLYDGQQIAYVDGFLEKVLADLHRPH